MGHDNSSGTCIARIPLPDSLIDMLQMVQAGQDSQQECQQQAEQHVTPGGTLLYKNETSTPALVRDSSPPITMFQRLQECSSKHVSTAGELTGSPSTPK